jgi:hypothetical protein
MDYFKPEKNYLKDLKWKCILKDWKKKMYLKDLTWKYILKIWNENVFERLKKKMYFESFKNEKNFSCWPVCVVAAVTAIANNQSSFKEYFLNFFLSFLWPDINALKMQALALNSHK